MSLDIFTLLLRYSTCFGLPAEAGIPDTTLAEPHPNSDTQQSKNNTADVVVQQHSRKLLKMDILMSETC